MQGRRVILIMALAEVRSVTLPQCGPDSHWTPMLAMLLLNKGEKYFSCLEIWATIAAVNFPVLCDIIVKEREASPCCLGSKECIPSHPSAAQISLS